MPNKNNLFTDAMSDAFVQSMQKNKNVLIMGEGVTDPKGIFNTTREALKRFGPQRVIETPVSENAMTGIQIGMSLLGKKSIFIHARVDFSLLAFDQLINNASKWHFMYGGTMNIPIVIRLIIGRGWGQGPQHSQSLLNTTRVHRIKNEIIQAAKNGEVYHLWWHPHNFGIDPEGAMKALHDIIQVFQQCQQTYGMESLTMRELAAPYLTHS
jgi:hypothetical protein